MLSIHDIREQESRKRRQREIIAAELNETIVVTALSRVAADPSDVSKNPHTPIKIIIDDWDRRPHASSGGTESSREFTRYCSRPLKLSPEETTYYQKSVSDEEFHKNYRSADM